MSPFSVDLLYISLVCVKDELEHNLTAFSTIDAVFVYPSIGHFECTYIYKVANESMSLIAKFNMASMMKDDSYTLTIGHGEINENNIERMYYTN